MPQFPTPGSASDTIAALHEALDLLGIGVAVLDRDLRARLVTHRFAEVWALPEAATPTLRQLADAVCSFSTQDAQGDATTAADRVEASVAAGAIPAAVVRLADGARRQLRCMVRLDGGRVLTCAELAAPDDAAAHSQPHPVAHPHPLPDHDAAERLHRTPLQP